ncbi:MAG: FGGY-family carbohydrate kinase [Cocleimonas sp.]
MNQNLSLGLDIGTSGVRGICINERQEVVAMAKSSFTDESREALRNPLNWKKMLSAVLSELDELIHLKNVISLSVDGQSGTVLLCDADGKLFDNISLLYNDEPSDKTISVLTQSIGSCPASLGRAYQLWNTLGQLQTFYIVHQADWIAGLLCGNFNLSDENNTLKMGYSPQQKMWDFDQSKLPFNPQSLPKVTTPAVLKGKSITPFAKQLGFSKECKVVTGTTDGTAGFIAASGIQNLAIGTAVTSLGTTLVIKTVSAKDINSMKFGVYSHKLFDVWVAGGASNSGAGVLLKYFTAEQLTELSKRIDPFIPSPLKYYPLLVKGERFPINDLQMTSQVVPRPNDDAEFLAGLFESIAGIEKQAYETLDSLGASYPTMVQTVGGGSFNNIWTSIRARVLGVEVVTAKHPEAAYGSALIAQFYNNN